MFCTNCGHEIDRSAAFCPYCGHKVKKLEESEGILSSVNSSTFIQQNKTHRAVSQSNKLFNEDLLSLILFVLFCL